MKCFLTNVSIVVFIGLIALWCSACSAIPQDDISAAAFSNATEHIVPPEKSISDSSRATASGLPDNARSPKTFFCTDGRGWVFYPGQGAGLPELFETKDRGQVWTPAEVRLPQGMDGVSYFITGLAQAHDEMMLVLQVKHNPPLASDIFYEFVLDETTGIWHWNMPAGASELGENALKFYNYMVSQTQYFPPDFTPETGLQDHVAIQKLIYDAAAWKAGNEFLGSPIFVSYKEVNQFAAALYGVADFDAAAMEKGDFTWFQSAEGGWRVSFEEYIGDGWETLLEDVQVNQEGIIEATTLTVFGPPDSGSVVPPIPRKSTLRCDSYEGTTVFTLLENEQNEYSGANWPTPHWLWPVE